MSRSVRVLLSVGGFALLSAAVLYLARRGAYGWTLFILLPLIAGGLGTWSFRPSSISHAIGIGVSIGGFGCSLFLLTGAEGFICLFMAMPVVLPLTTLGSLLAYWSSAPSKPAVIGLLVPVSLFFDVNAKPPVYSVTTATVINAPPERVWKYVVAFPDIPAQPDWVLRTGVAYPIRTRIDGNGAGARRNCDLSTGTVRERVLIWDEPRVLRFLVTSTPPAMREIGLYGPIHPKHLDGYYISKEGQFVLTALPGGRTSVVGTSWYQHGLWPAEYWRWWSDTVIHHIHRRVLNHIRTLSENKGGLDD